MGVRDPGAIVGPVRHVVWWKFTEREAPSVHKLSLTPEERVQLRNHDASPPDPGQQAEQLSAEWRRPLQMASGAVILVCPQFGVDGEPEMPHPLWDEVTVGLDTAQESPTGQDFPHNVVANRILPALVIPSRKANGRWTSPMQSTYLISSHQHL